MIRISAVGLVALMVLASPALARSVPYCPERGEGLTLEFSFSIGTPMTEMEKNEYYRDKLRRMGVDATGVTMWNGCIRAFVRDADGHGEHMEFYDPRTFEQVVLD